MKTCTSCKRTQSRTEFSLHRGNGDGLQAWCKSCKRDWQREHRRQNPEKWREYGNRYREKHRERIAANRRELYAANPEREARRTLGWRIKRDFGLTLDEYDAIIAKPCGLCGATEDIVLDHDHETNSVRGPLCQTCNKAIGMLGDDPQRLRAAASYIEEYRSHRVRT